MIAADVPRASAAGQATRWRGAMDGTDPITHWMPILTPRFARATLSLGAGARPADKRTCIRSICRRGSGGALGGNALAKRDSLARRHPQQVCSTPDDVVREFVGGPVNQNDFPHHLDDPA